MIFIPDGENNGCECNWEGCTKNATHIGVLCEECVRDGEQDGHGYCSEHYWHLRRHATHGEASIFWTEEEGSCECDDCERRLEDEAEGRPCPRQDCDEQEAYEKACEERRNHNV